VTARRRIEAAIALAVAATIGACGRAEDQPARRSIVVVTIDTLRADHLGSYGHAAARTPVLDGLAARGMRFEAATTPLPRTTPALASLMTGLLPWRHGSREVGQPMRPIATVPAILQARGYRTLGVCVNGAAGAAQNLHLGFDRFLDHESFADHTAAGVTDATAALVDQSVGPAGEKAAAPPVFLWVHYIDPHFPYAPPSDWKDQPAAPACRGLIERTGSDLVATAHTRIDLGGVASAALSDCAALYDAEIAFTDFHVGRLFERLAVHGIGRDAYVVVTADHGENLGEAGLFYEHGPSVHDASLRVPLVVAGPGIVPGVDSRPARLEDLAPTLLALAGVPAEEWPAFDGVDLSARLVGGRPAPGRAAVAVAESGGALFPETFTYLASGRAGGLQCVNGPRFSLCTEPKQEPRLYDHVADPFLERDVSAEFPDVREALAAVRGRWPPGAARERALRTEHHKLVARPRPQGGWAYSLYDLAVDPGETRDLAAEQPELAARMQRELEAAFAEVGAPADPELTPRELELLRALGYVR
jgi:arylsulfatase A-like enzyme